MGTYKSEKGFVSGLFRFTREITVSGDFLTVLMGNQTSLFMLLTRRTTSFSSELGRGKGGNTNLAEGQGSSIILIRSFASVTAAKNQ